MASAEKQAIDDTRAAIPGDEAFDSAVKEKPQRKWASYLWDTLDKSPKAKGEKVSLQT